MNKKVSVARLSVASNTILIIMKVAAGFLSGSVSIISEAIHSLMDLLASVVALFSVKVSDRPADEKHPYGHGKFENISGVIEASLIFVAAFWIIYEAIEKIINPREIEKIGVGVVVMMLSAIVNIIVSRKLYKVAWETGSVALEADALHLKTDVLTSFGVAMGLALLWITGIRILDPIIAIIVALMILKESYELFSRAFWPLIDHALPASEIAQITMIIQQHCRHKMTFHNLRTRKAGNYRYIDFHLNLDPELTVGEAHDICDQIESDIKNKIVNAEITIHVENFSDMNQ